MFDTNNSNNNTSNPFTLPKIGNETALSSLEVLSSTILLSKQLHDLNGNEKDGSSSKGSNSAKRTGRWTLDEKILFLYGLRKFGKGRWKKMSAYLPDRSLVQIKSHAQKVLKRLSEGEHVFRRLEENGGRLHALLAEFNETLDTNATYGNFPDEMESSLFPVQAPATHRRKRRKTAEHKAQSVLDGREHIIAASALCQLAAPTCPKRSEELYDPAATVISSASVTTLPSPLAASLFAAGTSWYTSRATTSLECALRGSTHVEK